MPPERSGSPSSRLLRGDEETVSTPHRQCVLSRLPGGGGCDAAWGDAGGSGGTCDSGGRQSAGGRGEWLRFIPIAAGREEAGSGRREQTTQNSKEDRS